MVQENREIKSSVFADLFGDDELDGKKNFLSLYNAIHGTNLKLEETTIEHKKIPQSICKPYDNDISMLINGRLIVLVEHQSTPNENMPLRCLEYYVHLLYGIIPAKARYHESLVKIPTPEFYVFYNGQRKTENEYIMKLSDAFWETQVEPSCELKETPTKDEQKTCYERAIREAISKNILVDYLTRKGTAVINMFTDEYDYNLDIQAKMEDATLRKAVEDATNMLRKRYPASDISEITGIPLEQVLELQKQIPVNA